ncbi:MAG TPA: ABATE domain-containing protein [Methylomirabilota bacterium]|jgi:predicted RNA-binding Zn ribbon-like protein|nr:ABATE domain-containing protein [Methylomirabilota bacterium]
MALCLDFANTVRRGPTPRDQLSRYADLVAWARRGGALTDAEARRLLGAARRRAAAATAALRRGRALREAIYRLLSAVADRRPARAADLATVNAAVAGALALSRLGARGGAFAWDWAGDRDALDRPLWPVARSAGELLTSGDLVAVRECAAPGCTRLFVDRSRNRTRRWCDMAVCGNRAKARRYYARSRSTSARSAGGKSYSAR